MSDAPSMTPIDHVREAERLLDIVQNRRDSSDPEIALRMAELHLKLADSINACASTARSSQAMERSSQAMEQMQGWMKKALGDD